MNNKSTNTNDATETIEIKDAEAFEAAMNTTDWSSPLYTALYNHFNEEMNKAKRGRICTPERMVKLYPIFREINIEMDEINEYWDSERRKQERKNQ